MISPRLESDAGTTQIPSVRRLYRLLSRRAYTVMMFAALFCTLVVKFFHASRYGLVNEYLNWILADVSFLLVIELILALVCFRWARALVVRLATVVAAVMCTWSVLNAGWLLRTGTQILPRVLLPLFRAPVHALHMIGVNLVEMPVAAAILLVPSAMVLAFFFVVLAKPALPTYNAKLFMIRAAVCIMIILTAVAVRPVLPKRGSPHVASAGLRHNSQLRAVISLVQADYRRPTEPRRKVPFFDEFSVPANPRQVNHNVIVVVLEGIQYQYTSLEDKRTDLTPYLAGLARQGAEFSNARSTLTHTTKALFSLFTGRFPSASQDLAEAVPAIRPYASVATILKNQMGYRTAFFQSALGNFESRPGLVYNLGFEKFQARDDLADPNDYLGYLGSDEFSMLGPVSDWIGTGAQPFFVTILCSATHDPYEVPDWFGVPFKEPLERYQQAILYTDKFLEALDVEVAKLNLADKTILCVIGDHGEAFGEHGQLGHERIAFDEVLRVPFCLRAPFLVEPGIKIVEPVSSVDLAPTLLPLLGFDIQPGSFDGVNALGAIPERRKVYFSGWMQEGPAGFVQGNRKFIYYPTDRTACVYDLATDPFELDRVELPEQEAERIGQDVTGWRRDTVFRIDQDRSGRVVLFDRWLCRWSSRVCSAKRQRRGGSLGS